MLFVLISCSSLFVILLVVLTLSVLILGFMNIICINNMVSFNNLYVLCLCQSRGRGHAVSTAAAAAAVSTAVVAAAAVAVKIGGLGKKKRDFRNPVVFATTHPNEFT